MEQAGANIAPFGGKKRRADLPLEHSPQKKGKSKGKGKGKGKDNGTGRCFQDSIEEEFDASVSSATSFSDSDDGDNYPLSPTPQTPFSPASKASPRFPSDRKTFHCPYDACSKSFNRPTRLNEHLRSHTGTRPFTCPYPPCVKTFLRDTHLKHHIRSAHSTVRNYACDWEGCETRFVTATRLRRHKAAHEGREKYKCAECGLNFRKHGTLQKHRTLVHEGKEPFVCDVVVDEETGEKCGVGYETLAKLRAHEGRVHAEKRFWCTVCSSDAQAEMDLGQRAEEGGKEAEGGFTTYASLQTHIKLAHPPTCAKCGLRCGSSRELTRHLEIVHGGRAISDRRTHLCSYPSCGQGFTRKGNLMVHMRTVHKNEKSFVCGEVHPRDLSKRKIAEWNGEDACGRAFTTKGNLEEHVRTAHLGLEHARKVREKRRQGKIGEEEQLSIPASKPKPATSVLTRLTGSGYADQSGRDIACLRAGCEYRFMRDYDLEVHLQTRHGLADVEIQDLQVQRGGRDLPTDSFWFRNSLDFRTSVQFDSEAERAFDVSLGMGVGMSMDANTGVDEDVEEAAARQAQLWLGDGGAHHQEEVVGGDDWWRDEFAMQKLARGEEDIGVLGDQAMIDPVLRV